MKLSSIIPQSVIAKIPDKMFIYLQYYQTKKKFLNLRNPQTYSEKLQWIKINGNLLAYQDYADKYKVRDYIAKTVGEKYLIPIYGCWDTFEDIPFELFPEKFALKDTHGSGNNFICTDKSKIDMDKLRKDVNRWLQENFYYTQREIQYKYIKPRLICEKYIEDETGELRDYKLTCSNGQIDFIEVHSNRSVNHTVLLTDGNWVPLEYKTIMPIPDPILPKPDNYDELMTVTKKLAKDFPFVRIDLYIVEGQIYFGELTFTPGDGTFPFVGQSDLGIGQLIDLSGFKKK
jgi:hypothetical protein